MNKKTYTKAVSLVVSICMLLTVMPATLVGAVTLDASNVIYNLTEDFSSGTLDTDFSVNDTTNVETALEDGALKATFKRTSGTSKNDNVKLTLDEPINTFDGKITIKFRYKEMGTNHIVGFPQIISDKAYTGTNVGTWSDGTNLSLIGQNPSDTNDKAIYIMIKSNKVEVISAAKREDNKGKWIDVEITYRNDITDSTGRVYLNAGVKFEGESQYTWTGDQKVVTHSNQFRFPLTAKQLAFVVANTYRSANDVIYFDDISVTQEKVALSSTTITDSATPIDKDSVELTFSSPVEIGTLKSSLTLTEDTVPLTIGTDYDVVALDGESKDYRTLNGTTFTSGLNSTFATKYRLTGLDYEKNYSLTIGSGLNAQIIDRVKPRAAYSETINFVTKEKVVLTMLGTSIAGDEAMGVDDINFTFSGPIDPVSLKNATTLTDTTNGLNETSFGYAVVDGNDKKVKLTGLKYNTSYSIVINDQVNVGANGYEPPASGANMYEGTFSTKQYDTFNVLFENYEAYDAGTSADATTVLPGQFIARSNNGPWKDETLYTVEDDGTGNKALRLRVSALLRWAKHVPFFFPLDEKVDLTKQRVTLSMKMRNDSNDEYEVKSFPGFVSQATLDAQSGNYNNIVHGLITHLAGGDQNGIGTVSLEENVAPLISANRWLSGSYTSVKYEFEPAEKNKVAVKVYTDETNTDNWVLRGDSYLKGINEFRSLAIVTFVPKAKITYDMWLDDLYLKVENPPEISDVGCYPADGATDVPSTISNATIPLNTPVQVDTVTKDTVKVYRIVDGVEKEVASDRYDPSVVIEGSTSKLNIAFSEGLEHGSEYKIVVNGVMSDSVVSSSTNDSIEFAVPYPSNATANATINTTTGAVSYTSTISAAVASPFVQTVVLKDGNGKILDIDINISSGSVTSFTPSGTFTIPSGVDASKCTVTMYTTGGYSGSTYPLAKSINATITLE